MIKIESVRIYLAGGMSGLSLEEQTKWRSQFINDVKNFTITKTPIFFDPTNYYSLFEKEHKSEREVMEFDLSHLRKSDLIVVNFNSPNSIGTAMELMFAKENKIPVIGFTEDESILHPWLIECCTRVCNSFIELLMHVSQFYLS